MEKHLVVLLASGLGTRMGLETPKQYQKIEGKYLLEYSLQTFQDHPAVDEIILVSLKDRIESIKKEILKKYSKLKDIVPGKAERHDSVYEGLKYFSSLYKTGKVLIHDSARPLLSSSIISGCFEALKNHSALTVASPLDDTPLEVNGAFLLKTLVRKNHLGCQTPQGFSLHEITKAHEHFRERPKQEVSDDTSIYHLTYPNEKIVVVEGDALNFKITHPHHLFFLKQWLKEKH